MPTAARRVRQLRLRADSREAVRRVLPALEDALRTASLPDAGGRLLLVRRLALGRIAADAAPSTLALALEGAVADAQIACLPAEAQGAAAAAAVWFRDALHAHTALALRLLEGPPPREWFWPLAVPAWSPGSSQDEALRALDISLAALPEAAVAGPAWRASLAARGHRARLSSAIGAGDPVDSPLPEESATPASRAAVAAMPTLRPQAPAPSRPDAVAAGPLPEAAARVSPPADRSQPGPAHSAEPANPVQDSPPAVAVSRLPEPSAPASMANAERGAVESASAAVPATVAPRTSSPAARAASAFVDAASARPPTLDMTSPSAAEAPRSASRLALAALEQAPYRGLPTAAGGIAFVLPVLARLGYPLWLADAPDQTAQRIAAAVLGAILQRLAVAESDPAWALAAVAAPRRAAAVTLPALPPAAWAQLARRGGGRPLAFDDGADAAPRETQAVALWTRAVHRWLRRHARIGLAALVRRPALLALTATHLDVRQDLSGVDLRIRRAGLDLDPGWLPWYGRVVGFHFERLSS